MGVPVASRFRQFWIVALLVLAPLVLARPVGAAELKISLAELARILSVTLGDAKLRLHNVPGGLLDLTPGSSLTIGSVSVPVAVPARDFDVSGVKYSYYVNNLDSGPITISAVPSALRFTIPFVTSGPAMIGKCTGGGVCYSDQILPEIKWSKAVVSFDLTPVWDNGNLSLNVKAVNIGGTFTPDCANAGGIFTGFTCDVILPKAKAAARSLKSDLAKSLIDQINADAMQAKLAAGLRSYLKFGPVGEARFQKVTVDPTMVTLTFCLACAADGS